MWMQERNGKFRFFEQYKDPLTNKTKIISITMKDHKKSTAKQAQIILDNRISKALSKVGIGKIIHGITLEQLLDEWGKQKTNQHTGHFCAKADKIKVWNCLL